MDWMDIRYVLSQDQEQGHLPTHGLLTQTLISSPKTLWILPCRLRDEYSNDVVFVRETSIEIKTLVDDILLQPIQVKEDFHSRICAAKVLGIFDDSGPVVKRDIADAIFKQEESLSRVSLDPKVPRQPQNSSLTTDGYKTANGDQAQPVNGNTIPKLGQPPPQILVMTLSREKRDSLVFLYLVQSSVSGEPCLVTYQRALPPPQEAGERHRLGRHLAVDPL